jgi:hypothetical protein
MHDDLVGVRNPADARRVFQVALVGVLEILMLRRQLVLPEAAVLDIALELVRVDLALAVLFAVGAAPARQRG